MIPETPLDGYIYLASPYSSADIRVRHERFLRVCYAAGVLMQKGWLVYSPIAASHPSAELCKLPTDFAYWEKLDRCMIQHSEAVIVLTLKGWEHSKGVAAEIAIAKELGKPVYFLEDFDE